jgi:hypothetical protein
MGLDLNSQLIKIKNDDRYNYRVIPMVGADGKNREMMSLNAYQIPAFLYSINPNKVRKDLRERIITFQNETFKVINEYWNNGVVVNQKMFQGKSIVHTINGLKSGLAHKDKKIESLLREIEKLNGQRLIPLKNKDEKLEVLFKRSDELLFKKQDYGSLVSSLQSHLKFYMEYIDIVRTSGTKLQQFSINQVEEEKAKRMEARESECNTIIKYDDMIRKVKTFIEASNQIALLKPI